MTTPSNTVQQLQIVGTLVRMGGMDVTRLQIECEDGTIVEVSNVASALLADMPMLLYKRVTLTVQAEVQPAPAAAPDDAKPQFGPITSDPADAERNIRAKEDPKLAEYLKRWEDAPEEAKHMVQDPNGRCWWVHGRIRGQCMPYQNSLGYWEGAIFTHADDNLLGSVRCEPRPEVQS